MADKPEITAEVLATWFQPRRALNLVGQSYPDIGVTSRLIIQRLRGGLIVAAAKTSAREGGGSPTAEVLIPASRWSHMPSNVDWWDTGQIRFFIPALSNRRVATSSFAVTYFGVRFRPSDIQDILQDAPPPRQPPKAASPAPLPTAPNAPAATAPPPPTPGSADGAPTHVGGRPKKEFWDDLIIEIARQIFDNELRPKRQADIVRAMLDWAADKNVDVSEPSLKPVARKIFAALMKVDKN